FRSPYGNQWSTYYAPVVTGARVFMAGGSYDGMYSFDALTGAQVWFVSTNQYNAWTPAVRDSLVYAYTGDYDPKVLAVTAPSGKTVFEIADPHFSWNGWSMHTAPVLGSSNDLLAVQAGRLVSFDLGTRALRYELNGRFTGAVTVSAAVLYLINDGRLEVRREIDGALLWSWSPPTGQLRGTSVVTRNLLFAATDNVTYAVDLGARRHTWAYPAGGSLALSAQGILFIARADGKLSAVTVR
ncbi:MAG: PQQ-binding-like beta-propeller repeat protein, partial [Tepidisphaeraceae bacterium]